MPAPPSKPPHALAGLPAILGRLPRYLVLARKLLGDPDLPKRRKAAVAAGLAYVASPLDFVPGVIPVAGQLDDLAALLLSLRFALQGCSDASRRAHLRGAGVAADDLDRDLAAVRTAAGWIAGHVASVSVRVATASARGARALVSAAGRFAVRGYQRQVRGKRG